MRLLAEARDQRSQARYHDAVTLCTKALRLNPRNSQAHSFLGDLYRDQGNFREALGWYKLAVRLEDSPEDRRKLDEMIDQVFKSAVHTSHEMKEHVVLRSGPEEIPLKLDDATHDNARGLRGFFGRLHPVHVVLSTSVLVVILVIVFLGPYIFGGTPRSNHTGNGHGQPGRPASTQQAPGVNGGSPQVTPPPADTVENPNGARPVPGLPGVVAVDPNRAASAAMPTPSAVPGGATRTPAQSAPEIKPFTPGISTPGTLDPAEMTRHTASLKQALDAAMASSPLPGSVDNVTIDSITGNTMITYTVPRMANATETKKGLLFNGLRLVWEAKSKSNVVRAFTVRGYAYEEGTGAPSLAMLTDISMQNADNARTMRDYNTLLPYLNNLWWRDDLKDAPL